MRRPGVAAGDEQERDHGSRQRIQCGSDLARHLLEQSRDGHACSRVRVGVLGGEAGGEQRELGASLIDRDVRPEPPDHPQHARIAPADIGIEPERDPDLGIRGHIAGE